MRFCKFVKKNKKKRRGKRKKKKGMGVGEEEPIKKKKKCRKEVATYRSGQLSKTVNQESVKEFSWKEILKDIQHQMPWIYSCLSGALTSRNKQDSMLEL